MRSRKPGRCGKSVLGSTHDLAGDLPDRHLLHLFGEELSREIRLYQGIEEYKF